MDSGECGSGQMGENKVIQWIIHGQHIDKDGLSHQRTPGDEDIVTEFMARKMNVAGLVEIIGTESEVMAGRVIDAGSAREIMKDMEEDL